MSKKFFVFDFDDTLYSHSAGRVPAGVPDVLKRLKHQGNIVAVATGRGKESIGFIINNLKFSPDIMILLNGQIIMENEKIIFERHIQLPSMRKIIDIAREHDFAFGGYCQYGEFVNQMNQRVHEVWERFSCPVPQIIESLDDNIHIYHGHLYIEKTEIKFFTNLLEEYILNWSDPYLVNLISKEGGKGCAVEFCMNRYGIALQDSVAFGDSFNDEDMLRSVGIGVAMGNGTNELKATANYITADINDGGVLKAIKWIGWED